MISVEIRAEIRRLVLRDGWKIETVARRFGVHHSVVRRMIRDDASLDGRRTPKGSLLDPHREYLVHRLGEHPELTSTRLLQELRERGYAGGVSVVRRYVAKIRAPRQRKAYLRVETDPGEQAQVDWGSFGQIRIGATQRPLSAFAMVLSWSRMLFVDFSLDQRADTFLRMHQRAFSVFGGVPKKLLYDNLKTVVLHHVGSTVQFNPAFLAFAGHYLFEPVAAPVRYPQAKGRVEGAIRYLRHAFFYGRQFRDLDDLRAQAAAWCRDGANQRLHATTRERPTERLLVERNRLRALPDHPYDAERVEVVIVSKHARVVLDTNSYSVPHRLVGQTVHLRANDSRVRVVHEGAVVAEHPRCWARRHAIEDPTHLQALLDKRPGARPIKLRDRIAALSTDARLYLQEVARRRIDLDSEIRKLERLLITYGEDDLVAALTAALAARTFGARYVRALADQLRFARGQGEPAEPIITGNPSADSIDVTPHDLESYDALFEETPEPPETELHPRHHGGHQPEPQPDR
jgi:transposase